MVYSTYQDVFYKTTADTMEYVIKQGDTYIFRGIAIKAPGADYAYIDVGKICKQYLENNLPDFRDFNDQITRLPNAFQKFTLSSVYHNIIWTGVETYLDDVTEQVEEIYRFLFNWDYERTAADNEGMPLSDPVNGHMDCRMKLIYTQYGETIGGDFYVTPLLSSPVMGATLTAKITTDYEDPSKLTVTVDNPNVTVQSYNLSGATFVTPENDGQTVAATVIYRYDGEEVGRTTIILAGKQGGDPDTPQTGTSIYKANIYINGYPNPSTYFGARRGILAYIDLDKYIYASGYTVSVTPSEHVSGGTRAIKVVDDSAPEGWKWEIRPRYIDFELIDSGSPAQIGEQVIVTIKKDNAVTSLTATVIVTNSGNTVDSRYSSWFSVDVSDTSEAPYIVSNTYRHPETDKHGKSQTIDFNTVYFGDYLSSSEEYHVLQIGGRQIFPGGNVVNGLSPLTVSTTESGGKKTYKYTSPYPMNGLHIIDWAASGYTSADNVSCSIMSGITVEKRPPERTVTTSYPCSGYTNKLTEITIPITMPTLINYPNGGTNGKVFYGKRDTWATCWDMEDKTYINVHTADGSSAKWDLGMDTLTILS